MAIKFSNNASATLAVGINASATGITVTTGQGALFPTLAPSDYFYATLSNAANNIEIVKVAARAGDAMTVVRGQEGTTAQSFLVGDKFELRPTAAGLEDISEGTNITALSGVALSGGSLTNAAITDGTIDDAPIGATTPNTGAFTSLDVSGDANFTGTGALKLPAGTQAQRPGTPVSGDLRFNSDINKPEIYNGSSWGSVGGGATGGGADEVFIQNKPTVTTSYTLSTGYNAMSTGPITINNGVTVTVPNGQRWVVI